MATPAASRAFPSPPAASELPFAGLRVLDISQGIAGPYCAHILWQQGAEVIKVDPPSGDWGRHVGVVRGELSALAIAYNGGKRGVCIDAATPDGRRLLRTLARQADVVVQNFRPQVATRLGVGYADLAAEQPALVYVSISGYGADGPYADHPASDSVMQADSGLMFTNRGADGTPRRVGMLLADAATGLYAAQAAAAALCRRFRREAMPAPQGAPSGAHVELSLFDACCALQANNILEYAIQGAVAAGPVSAPNGVFATRDGSLSVLALNNAQFSRLCQALERPEWLQDARFADNAARMAHAPWLHAAVADCLARHDTAHWQRVLQAHDVLHAPVRDYHQVLDHPQAAQQGSFQPLAQPGLGTLPFAGVPARGLRRPAGAAPRIGEHTEAVLSEAGIAPAQIAAWLRDGVVRQAPALPAAHGDLA
ncbi:CaiB/BaiF CoA transferase family protein [Cupriavidus malaysiensis]|uniref:LysR family transcriptional regulator n=1 Tax=Cupriavidus malaysiensis TaxID=367825 RepID=A0ABM6FC13_9BURK|nr:CoA transferase [Cupriavidus malaysiensis]AOZ09252.1 LysR family transcriptional regulator [Cupriavidus malaysiensis]